MSPIDNVLLEYLDKYFTMLNGKIPMTIFYEHTMTIKLNFRIVPNDRYIYIYLVNLVNLTMIKKLSNIIPINTLIIFIIIGLSITIPNIPFILVMAQNSTFENNNTNLLENGNQIVIVNRTENEAPGGEPLPQLIITLKDNADNIAETESFGDIAESVTAKVERNGIATTINETFPLFNQFAINIETPSESASMDSLSGHEIDPSNSTQRLAATINQTINILKQDPQVESVSQNIRQDAWTTNSLSQILPTGINRTDADLSSPPGKSGDKQDDVDIDIAILDCGVNEHNDLNLLVDRQISTIVGSIPTDHNGHGTHVAGTAAAKDNDFGVVGTAPGARIWNVKVLEHDPSTGGCSGDTLSIIRGLQYVATHANEIDVANLSLGGQCGRWQANCLNDDYENAINDVVNRGVVVVVAAGNSGKDATDYVPARFQSVITVSNVADSDGKCGSKGGPTHRGPDDSLASNSNYGPVIDVAAPGVNILSTYLDNTYAKLSGTSMSAPHVAGEAALYKSLNPLASPSDVRNEIMAIGSDFLTQCNGNGFGYFTGDKEGLQEPLINLQHIKNH